MSSTTTATTGALPDSTAPTIGAGSDNALAVAPGFGDIELGVLTDIAFHDEADPGVVGDSGLGLEMLGCWTAWPDLYVFDFELLSSEVVVFPVRAQLSWAATSSDSIGLEAYDIVLSGPGRFSVPLRRLYAWPPPDDVWDGQRRVFPEGETCYAEVPGAEMVVSGPAQPRVEPSRIVGDGADGTLQALVADVDPTDPSDPMWPLSDLYMQSDSLPFDRVYVDLDNSMEAIGVTVDGPCVIVRSFYTDGLSVHQARGCEEVGSAWYDETHPVRFEDDAWYIALANPSGAAVAAEDDLTVVPVEGVGPLGSDGKAFDADTWLDAHNHTHNLTEIGRLDVGAGRISIVTGEDESGPWLQELIVGLGDSGVVNSSIRGLDDWQACARWGVHDTTAGSYLVVIAADPTWTVEALLDTWTPIALSGANGYGIGLTRLNEWREAPELRAFERDGAPVTCFSDL